MSSLAFVSPFIGRRTSIDHCNHLPLRCRRVRRMPSQLVIVRSLKAQLQTAPRDHAERHGKSNRLIGIVGKAKIETETSVEVDPNRQKGLFGVKAKAYWDSMGVLPLFFAGFGIVALAIKMVKVKSGEWKSGPNGVNKVNIPKTVITTEEEEAELHVFKCGGCGYEMYPARGRESVFFPDSFKCPLCKTPKSEFWDLNDPTDPRNQVSDDEEDEDGEDDEDNEDSEDSEDNQDNQDDVISGSSGNGSASITSDDPPKGSRSAETQAKDLTEPDSSI